ncbi:MAG TPA: GyrI-like domain-containing protein [Thermoplasmata archaeon]|jgi:AraC family transcriptional regulator
MATAKLEKRKATTLAYIEYVGGYGSIPFDKYIPRLYEWVKTKKIMPGFYPICVFHSDPKTTPPEKCMTDIAITVKGNPKAEGDIKIRKLPAMTVATFSHKGPGSEYQRSYDVLGQFVKEKGYTVIGPPIEIYSKKPEMADGQLIIYAKIMFPVRKL